MPHASTPCSSQARLPERQAKTSVASIVVIYAVFAALWILVSDNAVEWLFIDPSRVALANTFKGLAFVAVTSLLLRGLLRRMGTRYGAESLEFRTDPLASEATDSPSSKFANLPLAVMAVAIATLTVVAIAYHFVEQREKGAAQLQAIADLKVRAIADWLTERRGDARFLQTTRVLADNFQRWQDAGDLASRDLLRKRLERFAKDKGYAAILLLDEHGDRLWGAGRTANAITDGLRARAGEVADHREVGQYGPYRRPDGKLRLAFLAPLTIPGGHGTVVVLEADPATWLFPSLQSWPVPSASGETLLVRRGGDRVLFLNDLRHRADAALKLRVPIAAAELLAAQGLRGEVGEGTLVDGVDYRGVPASGVVRSVPGTDWLLVAKMDRSELYADAFKDSAWISLAGLLALFMAVGSAYLRRQRQGLAAARRIRESQAEKLRALSQRLELQEQLSRIAASVPGVIFSFKRRPDGSTCMPFTTPAVEDLFGVSQTGLAESISAWAANVHPDDVQRLNGKVAEAARTFTPWHDQYRYRHPSKGLRWIEGWSVPRREEDGSIVWHGFVMDVTERKQVDAALIDSKVRYEKLVQRIPVGVFLYCIHANGFMALEYVSPRFCQILDLDADTALRDINRAFAKIHPDDLESLMRSIDQARVTLEPYHYECRCVVAGETIRVRLQADATPLPNGDSLWNGILSDTTVAWRAEQALRESEARFRTLFHSAAVAIIVHDRDTGAVIAANRRAIEGYGYETLEELQKNDFWLGPPYGFEDALCLIRKAVADGPQRFEWMNRDKHGRVFWEDVLLKTLTLNGIERVMAVTTDITDRKAAEEAFHRQTEDLQSRNAELERFNRAAVGRELKMIELKKQINALSRETGREPPFALAFLGTTDEPPVAKAR